MSEKQLDHAGVNFSLVMLGFGVTGFIMAHDEGNPGFFWIGIVFCLLAALMTWIRYGGDIKVVVQSRSIRLLDLTLTTVVFCILMEIAAPASMLFVRYVQPREPTSPSALQPGPDGRIPLNPQGSRLQIVGINPYGVIDESRYDPKTVSITYRNIGKISSFTPQRQEYLLISKGIAPQSTIEAIFEHIKKEAMSERYSIGDKNEMLPGIDYTVENPQTLDPMQIEDVQGSKAHLYYIDIIKYKDELTPPGFVNISEICMHSSGDFKILTTCEGGHNVAYIEKELIN